MPSNCRPSLVENWNVVVVKNLHRAGRAPQRRNYPLEHLHDQNASNHFWSRASLSLRITTAAEAGEALSDRREDQPPAASAPIEPDADGQHLGRHGSEDCPSLTAPSQNQNPILRG